MATYRFIGRPIARIEDAALLTGAGRFVDDVPVPDALEAAFVRSSFAHARIKSVDVAAARAAPGVHAVLTYADIRPLLTADRMPLELRVEMLPPNVTPYPLARDEVVFRRRGDRGGDRRQPLCGRGCRRAGRGGVRGGSATART